MDKRVKRKRSVRKLGKKRKNSGASDIPPIWKHGQTASISVDSDPVLTPHQSLDSSDDGYAETTLANVLKSFENMSTEQRKYFRNMQNDLSVISQQITTTSEVLGLSISQSNDTQTNDSKSLATKIAYLKNVCERTESGLNDYTEWAKVSADVPRLVTDNPGNKEKCCIIQ